MADSPETSGHVWTPPTEAIGASEGRIQSSVGFGPGKTELDWTIGRGITPIGPDSQPLAQATAPKEAQSHKEGFREKIAAFIRFLRGGDKAPQPTA